MMTLVVVGKDQAAVDAFDRSHVDCDLRLITNTENRALASIANEHLQTSLPVFGLVHADTVFREGALEAFEADAMAGAVCGIVGRSVEGHYRWCFKDPKFVQGVVRGPGPVCTLDGCSVFFRVDHGLQFDSFNFNSFHCHVEDLCMQANKRGIPVIVTHANATHASQVPSPAWSALYWPYRQRLASKWHGYLVMTT